MWVRLAGISGASAIALGAIGAHALNNRSDAMKETWRVGSLYHLTHSIVLFQLATSSISSISIRKRNITTFLFTTGIVLFSGSCYTVVIMNERKPYSQLAPLGGVSLICGWLALAFL